MAKQGDLIITVVIIMAVVAVIALPSIMATGSDFLQGISDFITEGFGNGLGGSDSRVSLLVHYDDGTEQLFDSAGLPAYSIADPDSNKIVEWIKPIVKISVDKSGTVTSWSLSGTLTIRLMPDVGSVVIHEWTYPFSKTGTAWLNLEVKEVYEQQLTADEIESKIMDAGGYEDNDYFKLSLAGTLESFSISFSDGRTESWAQVPKTYKTTWTFVWLTSELKSVSISVNFVKG